MRHLLACALVCLGQQSLLGIAMATPGMGKLPLAPIPIELPNPQRPGRLQITPTRPMMPVIPSVIFRPPSEVLRNFGEIQPYNQFNTVPADDTASNADLRSTARQPNASPAANVSTDPALPSERPTRRQTLGW